MFLRSEYSELESAMLTGYSVFTTFTVEKRENRFETKAFTLHIERLQSNVKVLFGEEGIPSRKEIVQKIHEFLSVQSVSKILVRVAIYPKNFSIAYPSAIESVEILVTGRKYNSDKTPLRLQSHEMLRPLAHLKTSALFPSLRTRAQAQKNGYDDAVFFYEGNITEGPAWNIIFTKGNTVYFPDPSHKTFLEGFTQRLLQEELQKKYKGIIDVKVQDITIADIHTSFFDSAFIVSSGVDLIPIASIDDVQFIGKTPEKSLDLITLYNSIEPEIIV